MGSHGSISTELRLRADDLKHLVRPKYVKGLTRSDVQYARPMFGSEPLFGQEILAIVGRFRHHIDGSGSLLSSSWEALTYDLAAVFGNVDETKPLSFDGVTTHTFDRFMNAPERSNDAQWHLFVLGPGELVRAIDICWHDHRLVGVRLQSNQRQSPWFGKHGGVIKTVTAPQGYFINAIGNLKVRTGRDELGLRLCPVTDRLIGGVSLGITTENSSTVGTPPQKEGVQTDFAEWHEEVRAIVVTVLPAGGIRDLHVLSAEMYNRHLAKRDDPLPALEHLLFLRHSEYVTAVEVRTAPFIVALRFHTNLMKSPWYGKGSTGGKEPAVFQTHKLQKPKQQICGVHGMFGTNMLGTLGVVFGPIPSEEVTTAIKRKSNKLAAP